MVLGKRYYICNRDGDKDPVRLFKFKKADVRSFNAKNKEKFTSYETIWWI